MNAQPDDLQRELPSAIDAEYAVAGAAVIAPEAMAEVGDWIGPEHFQHTGLRAIFAAAREFAGRGEPFDATTAIEHFEGLGERETALLVFDLNRNTWTAANVTAYAEIVVEKARLRSLIEEGQKLIDAGFAPQGRRADDLAMETSTALLNLSGGARARGPRSLREIGLRWFDDLQERYLSGGGIRGLATPWGKLNALTLGLNAGDLVIAAGRPSMGKSALAVNMGTSAALRGKRVMFFNLEMTGESIFTRCVASVGNVPLEWLRAGGTGGDVDYWPAVTAAVSALRDAPLIIDDTPGLAAQQIVSRAKREHLRGALDLVIVDHLHLVKLGKGDTVRELQEATGAFKALAKSLGCPVVVLSQLNRSLESRADKHPQLADLRESGAIEQDADLIVFLYRDDYYAEREERPSRFPGWVELVVAKQREGRTGRVWLRDDLAHAVLEDYDGPAPDAMQPIAEPRPRRMPSRMQPIRRDRAVGDDR